MAEVLDLDELKNDFRKVGEDLIASGVLTPEERKKVGEWTVGLGVAYATGDLVAAGNYRQSISTVFGVVEVRLASEAEKSALRLANRCLDVLVKLALTALV